MHCSVSNDINLSTISDGQLLHELTRRPDSSLYTALLLVTTSLKVSVRCVVRDKGIFIANKPNALSEYENEVCRKL